MNPDFPNYHLTIPVEWYKSVNAGKYLSFKEWDATQKFGSHKTIEIKPFLYSHPIAFRDSVFDIDYDSI